jgi:hypothetical protein
MLLKALCCTMTIFTVIGLVGIRLRQARERQLRRRSQR